MTDRTDRATFRRGDDAIRLRAIAKSFPLSRRTIRPRHGRRTDADHKSVLRHVSLDVRAGEILGLIGANGAGKTTLLEIVATLQRPTGGTGIVGGHDLVADPDGVRRIVGYCPAAADSFYPRLTGAANLEFFAALHGLSPRDARVRTDAVLDLLSARDLHDVVFQRCSAGMKHKLGLARALLGSPSVLLLDEPTRSLDPPSQDDLHDLLRMLAASHRLTVLLVTHNLHEAAQICDRVALLRGGEIAGVWPADRLPAQLRAWTVDEFDGERRAMEA